MPERRSRLFQQQKLMALQARVDERLRQEMPPQDETVANIHSVHRRLRRLARTARRIGAVPFDPQVVQSDVEAVISPNTSPAAFWSHFIGGPMHVIPMQFMLAREMPGHIFPEEGIRAAQKRVYDLLDIWRTHPGNPNKPLMRVGDVSFARAAFAFDWATNEALITKLNSETTRLASLHGLLEGHLPLSRVTQIIQEEQTRP